MQNKNRALCYHQERTIVELESHVSSTWKSRGVLSSDDSCFHHILRTHKIYYQLPDGAIAQLVEHCSGIAEVIGSNPIEALILQLHLHSCDD